MKEVLLKITASGNAEAKVKTINKEVKNLKEHATNASGSMDSLASNVQKWGLAYLSISKLTSAIQTCTAAFNVQSLAENKLQTIMRQRMGATVADIEQIKNLASAQQKIGIIGDEVALSGVQQIATFARQKSTLEKLLPAMNNLLAQQKGYNATAEDAAQIGNLMGKVLQGQTAALTRVGITFTDAQEKVLKYGTESQKAAALAQVITDNIGNMNAALANTKEGQIKQLKNAFGDLQEKIGALLVRIGAKFLPLLNKVVYIGEKVIDFLDKWGHVVLIVGAGIGTLLLWMNKAVIATKLWAAAQGILNLVLSINPIGAVIIGITALVAAIAVLWAKCEGFSNRVLAWLGPLGRVLYVMKLLKLNFEELKSAFSVDGIGAGFRKLGDILLEGVLMPVQTLLEALSSIPLIGEKVSAAAAKISKIRAGLNLRTEAEKGSTKKSLLEGVSQRLGASFGADSAAEVAGANITAGGAAKSIVINLGKFVENLNYTGSLEENEEDTLAHFTALFQRVLATANG